MLCIISEINTVVYFFRSYVAANDSRIAENYFLLWFTALLLSSFIENEDWFIVLFNLYLIIKRLTNEN